MDESWRNLTEIHERIRWARLRRYPKATPAARDLGIKPGTYRTYEVGEADSGRTPTNETLQKMGQKFGVSWVWLVNGRGSPQAKDIDQIDELLVSIAQKLEGVPGEKKQDALRAVEGVLSAYQKAG